MILHSFKTRGSILVESCLLFSISLLIIVIQIEVIRRSWASVISQLLAFEDVRERVIGFEGTHNFYDKTSHKLVRSWRFYQSLPIEIIRDEYLRGTSGEAVSRIHIKYPSIISLRENSGVKKINFEVTEQCRFPFSF